MATTSACAVGSFVEVTRLTPVATTWPLRTTTAPNGPPTPEVTFCVASSIAFCIKMGLPSMTGLLPFASGLNAASAHCILKNLWRIIAIMAQAFIADRVVTPQGAQRAALLLEEGEAGTIRAV